MSYGAGSPVGFLCADHKYGVLKGIKVGGPVYEGTHLVYKASVTA
jgi:hypothetical protein